MALLDSGFGGLVCYWLFWLLDCRFGFSVCCGLRLSLVADGDWRLVSGVCIAVGGVVC